jgi:hypothetical protein
MFDYVLILFQNSFCLALALGAAYVDDELLEMLGLKLPQGMGLGSEAGEARFDDFEQDVMQILALLGL